MNKATLLKGLIMLEQMDEFFRRRVEGYDEHMLKSVEGCAEGYMRMAQALPEGIGTLLDLGCGTGLELDPIFDRFPSLQVTGIDLSEAMLDKLREKYPEKSLRLIQASYLDRSFGLSLFDAAVSFETLHHLKPDEKQRLYRQLFDALRPGGLYVECDYMVVSEEEESQNFAALEAQRASLNAAETTLFHFDTPCTISRQLSLLRDAGFSAVEQVWRNGNTSMLLAKKSEYFRKEKRNAS